MIHYLDQQLWEVDFTRYAYALVTVQPPSPQPSPARGRVGENQ